MADPAVPFFTLTAVLDKYIHSSTLEEEPEILEIIIEALKTRPELREYFFRNGPHPAWAKILWENGFFKTPPPPKETKEGTFLTHWDVQIYLDSVADQVPEIVLQHVMEFQGHGWYVSRALHALLRTPLETIEKSVPRILEWLLDPVVSPRIDDIACELMFKLAEGSREDLTFALFKNLTVPVQKGEPNSVTHEFWSGTAVRTIAEHLLDQRVYPQPKLQTLENLNPIKYTEILEENLRALLILESQVYDQPSAMNSSWWRSAIEDTNQDTLDRDRDNLLRYLRTSLENQLKVDINAALPFITRYLADSNRLFYRLGLYLMSVSPIQFIGLIKPILLSPGNYSDTEIRHEFFVTLQNAFRYLTSEQQDTVLNIIFGGPPQEETILFKRRVVQETEENQKELVDKYIRYWLRDRLWMIKEDLPTEYKEVLEEIVADLGEPEHPSFHSWSSEGYWVKQVAPLTDQELANMSPIELVQFLENWVPDHQQRFGPTEISYEGLASSLGKLIINSFEKYSLHLFEIAVIRADYVTAILNQLSEPSYEIVNWDIWLSLCERIMADNSIRTSTTTAKGNWAWMRRAIVKLLEKGLNKESSYEQLGRFRDLLLILVDDPSPTPEEDRPPEGWFGHSDPMTVAINYTRPMAVNALIEYARIRAHSLKIGDLNYSGPNRLEEPVQQALSKKLDPSKESSLAVRSVFGKCTATLYWLNKEWWLSNLDAIFPNVEDGESLLLFAAAWDSFVINPFYTHLVKYLRAKYIQAISMVAQGQTTKPSFYSPVSHLAGHLVWEYLLRGTELDEPVGLEDSMLKTFFLETGPEARGQAVNACSHILHNHLSENAQYWQKIRVLWEWRAQEASSAGYSTDFHDEMIHFADILPDIPETETIKKLWHLLEILLPYIARSEYRNDGWDSVEKFLLMRFKDEPVQSIQYYSLLWNQRKTRPDWFHHSEDAITLVSLAVENPKSRADGLRLIDFLARLGDYSFRDLYERYSH